jgi:hypothetical protein
MSRTTWQQATPSSSGWQSISVRATAPARRRPSKRAAGPAGERPAHDASLLAADAGGGPRRAGDHPAGLGEQAGLEDNVRVTKDHLAASNAELVRLAVDLCARHGARPRPAHDASLLAADAGGGPRRAGDHPAGLGEQDVEPGPTRCAPASRTTSG